MRQYEFNIKKELSDSIIYNSVFCTAQTEEKALRAVRAKYEPEFIVQAVPAQSFEAHKFYCEIDATA